MAPKKVRRRRQTRNLPVRLDFFAHLFGWMRDNPVLFFATWRPVVPRQGRVNGRSDASQRSGGAHLAASHRRAVVHTPRLQGVVQGGGLTRILGPMREPTYGNFGNMGGDCDQKRGALC
jgi:hypothetical protein